MPTQIPSTRPAARDPLAERVGEAARARARARAAPALPDTGDHGERRVAHLGRVGATRPARAPARANAEQTLRRLPAP